MHGNGPAVGVGHTTLGVNPIGEGVTQSHRRTEHLDADQEVLVAGRHGTGGCAGTVAVDDGGDNVSLF